MCRITNILTKIKRTFIYSIQCIKRWLRLNMRRRHWKRRALWLNATRSFLIDFSAVLVLVAVIVLITLEFLREIVVIEPIEIPKRLNDVGYTSHVVARELMGHIFQIRAQADTTIEQLVVATADDSPDIVVPGAGFSIRAAVGYVKAFAGDRSIKITGEITEHNNLFQLHLRVNGRSFYTQNRGVAIFAKAFLGIPAQQAAKITRPLMPSAAPAVLLHSLHTQQGVCNIVIAMTRRDFAKACIFTTHKALRENTCPIASGDYSTPVSQRRHSDKLDELITDGAKLVIGESEPIILASYLVEYGKDDDALQVIKKILIKAPEKSEPAARAYNLWGILLRKDKDRDRAIEMYKKALENKKNAPYALLNIGKALAQKHDYDGSIEYYHRAAKFNPNNAEANIGYGLALMSNDEWIQANEFLDKAIQLDESRPNASLYLGRGLVDYHNQLWFNAMINFIKASQIDPLNDYSRFYIWATRTHLGEYEDA